MQTGGGGGIWGMPKRKVFFWDSFPKDCGDDGVKGSSFLKCVVSIWALPIRGGV